MKVLIIAIFPAPYRVAVFNELGKSVELTVIFERQTDSKRSSKWFSNQFNQFTGYLLCDKTQKNRKAIKTTNQLLYEKKFDLVILYDYSTRHSLYYLLLCRLRNIPYFLNCDGAFINKSKIKGLIKRFYIKNAVGYLASGKMAARYFEYFGAKRENIHFHPFTSLYAKDIANAVGSPKEKRELRKELALTGEKIVITVSRFIPSKRIDILIEAWSHVAKEYQLIIVGSGDLEQKYKKMVTSLELSNVLFTGFLEKEEIVPYLRGSDVFVLPTESDTWGLVINEAMACGIPVITTEQCVAGLELIKTDINGILVPAKDVRALYQALDHLLSNEALLLKLSKNALKTIKPYTYENIAASHLEAINQFFEKIEGKV